MATCSNGWARCKVQTGYEDEDEVHNGNIGDRGTTSGHWPLWPSEVKRARERSKVSQSRQLVPKIYHANREWAVRSAGAGCVVLPKQRFEACLSATEATEEGGEKVLPPRNLYSVERRNDTARMNDQGSCEAWFWLALIGC